MKNNRWFICILLIFSFIINQLLFVTADDQTYRWGDLNGDDTINATDAYIVLISVCTRPLDMDEQFVKLADVNGDLKVNAKDALLILMKSISLIEEFPSRTVYKLDEIKEFYSLMCNLKPIDTSEGNVLADEYGNPCYYINMENIVQTSANLKPINKETPFSWFCIYDIDDDNNLELLMVNDGFGPLSVEVCVFENINGELVYNLSSTATIKTGVKNILYWPTEYAIVKDINLYAIGNSPAKIIEESYLIQQ